MTIESREEKKQEEITTMKLLWQKLEAQGPRAGCDSFGDCIGCGASSSTPLELKCLDLAETCCLNNFFDKGLKKKKKKGMVKNVIVQMICVYGFLELFFVVSQGTGNSQFASLIVSLLSMRYYDMFWGAVLLSKTIKICALG